MQQDPETQVVLSRLGDDVAFGAENLSVPRDADLGARARGAGRRRAGAPAAGPPDVGPVRRAETAPGAGRHPGDAARADPAGRAHGQPRPRRRPGSPRRRGPLPRQDRAPRWWSWSTGWPCGRTSWTGSWSCSRAPRREPAVLLDGPPDQVLAEARGHADRCRRLGAGLRSGHAAADPWRPASGRGACHRWTVPPRGEPALAPGQLLLAAEGLAVSRERPRRRGFRSIPPVPVLRDITAQVRAAGPDHHRPQRRRANPPSR